MGVEIKIRRYSNGNLVVDVYVGGNWFKQIIPEGEVTVKEALNCVAESLENDEGFNMPW